jgi:hypothetical protein
MNMQDEFSKTLLAYLVDASAQANPYGHRNFKWQMNQSWYQECEELTDVGPPIWQQAGLARFLVGYPIQVDARFGAPELVEF